MPLPPRNVFDDLQKNKLMTMYLFLLYVPLNTFSFFLLHLFRHSILEQKETVLGNSSAIS